ncbi:hypothetical protein D3C81_743350 [compost metagenome]
MPPIPSGHPRRKSCSAMACWGSARWIACRVSFRRCRSNTGVCARPLARSRPVACCCNPLSVASGCWGCSNWPGWSPWASVNCCCCRRPPHVWPQPWRFWSAIRRSRPCWRKPVARPMKWRNRRCNWSSRRRHWKPSNRRCAPPRPGIAGLSKRRRTACWWSMPKDRSCAPIANWISCSAIAPVSCSASPSIVWCRWPAEGATRRCARASWPTAPLARWGPTWTTCKACAKTEVCSRQRSACRICRAWKGTAYACARRCAT